MLITLQMGDITQIEADVIVNAANSNLLGGGGVDGAIHRAGGPEILAACKKIRSESGRCPTGGAVATTAGRLSADYVIHTVGPVWTGGTADEARLLAECYRNSLKLAESLGATSVAFPNISTGVYGYPRERAAPIALAAVRGFEYHVVSEVIFVCFDEVNYGLYRELLA